MSIPKAAKLMVEAAAALEKGDFDLALNLKEQAERAEPRLRREARKAPKTVEELMPLLRRKDAAGPVMRQFRQSLGLSQLEMAEICGVTQPNVAHWEGGRQVMSSDAAERLMRWIGERGVQKIGDGPTPAALLKLRKALGFTTMALAYRLDIKESFIRRIENGGMPVSIDIAERYRQLASEHGLDLDTLAA